MPPRHGDAGRSPSHQSILRALSTEELNRWAISERQDRFPTMPIITEVRFAHEDGALADTLRAFPDLAVAVLPQASTEPNRSVYLFQFDETGTAEVQAALEADHTVHRVEPMPQFEAEQILGIEFAAGTKLLAPEVTRAGGFVLEARSTTTSNGTRGWYERWLLPDRESLHAIWEHARETGFEFEVLEFHQQGQTDPAYPGLHAPTDQQREALLTAYERGYFAEPRETSLEELAEELDRSPTAVAGRLKRGMRSLIGMTLVTEESEE